MTLKLVVWDGSSRCYWIKGFLTGFCGFRWMGEAPKSFVCTCDLRSNERLDFKIREIHFIVMTFIIL